MRWHEGAPCFQERLLDDPGQIELAPELYLHVEPCERYRYSLHSVWLRVSLWTEEQRPDTIEHKRLSKSVI